ncbi:hypothetical protein EMCRGX_G002736 [Ephydatia muelleri]
MNNIFLRRAVCNAANIRKERCKRCDFGICSSCCKCVKPKGRPWKILRDIEPIRVNVARNARPSLEFLSLEDEIPDYDFVEPVITEVEQLVTVPSDAGSISPRGGTMHVADREDSDDSDGDGENALLALNASELAVRSIALSIANCRGTTTSVKARMLMAQMSDLTSNYVEGEGGRKVSTAKQLAVALSSKCVKDTTVLLVKPKHDAPFVSTKVPAIQAGSSRGITDTPRGTPSVMDTARLKLQTNMADIKNMMTDIAHASHHVDHLSKAVESNRLPKGLTVEPRMMLVGANEDTEREWKEQTKINTLGYINVAKQHYARLIAQKLRQ